MCTVISLPGQNQPSPALSFQVKIWNLPSQGITEDFNDNPIMKLSDFSSRPECISFHPIAENILAIGCGSKLFIADVENGGIASGKNPHLQFMAVFRLVSCWLVRHEPQWWF